jgi:carboxymethylenebutenolidase
VTRCSPERRAGQCGPAARPGILRSRAGSASAVLITGSTSTTTGEFTAQVHLGLAEGDMKPGAISKLNQALDAAGVGYTTEIYPGTIHGFTMSDTDAFNPSALRRHWDRLLPLLDRTLGACPGQSR